METEAQWYYSNDGEQSGPVTADELQELAAAGTITHESTLWTEGLEDWVRATQVGGLFPEAEEEATGAEAPSPAPEAGIEPEAPVAEYPAARCRRAGFAKLAAFVVGGPLLGLLGLILGATQFAAAMEGDPTAEDYDRALIGFLIVMGSYYLGVTLAIVGAVFAMMYLHRAWSLLRWGTPRTTPGKAVGFLFIPGFNLYWIFVAYYGLAKDWNRVIASFPDLSNAPRMRQDLFLIFCIAIVSLIGLPVAVIAWFMIYTDICKGINFMANRAMMQARPTGMHFY